MKKVLIIISGPSAVGKKCIMEGIELYCNLNLIQTTFNKVTLYNTRGIRSNEQDSTDYHYCYGDYLNLGNQNIKEKKKEVNKLFTPQNLEVEKLIFSNLFKDFYLYPVRNKDLQGLDLNDIKEGVNFLEIYDPFISNVLNNQEFNIWKNENNLKVLRVFIAPLTYNEIEIRSHQNNFSKEEVIKNEMRKKIKQRIMFGLSNEDEKKIADRIQDAAIEVLEAYKNRDKYDVVLINHSSETDPEWGKSNTIPTGKAKTLLDTLAQVINSNI